MPLFTCVPRWRNSASTKKKEQYGKGKVRAGHTLTAARCLHAHPVTTIFELEKKWNGHDESYVVLMWCGWSYVKRKYMRRVKNRSMRMEWTSY